MNRTTISFYQTDQIKKEKYCLFINGQGKKAHNETN